jgi:hypothetical protein
MYNTGPHLRHEDARSAAKPRQDEAIIALRWRRCVQHEAKREGERLIVVPQQCLNERHIDPRVVICVWQERGRFSASGLCLLRLTNAPALRIMPKCPREPGA